MTRDGDFKRLVRARMTDTGERYATARAALLRDGKEAGMIPVTVHVVVEFLSEDKAIKRAELIAEAREEGWEKAFTGWDTVDKQPWVVLTEMDGDRELPIGVGPVEATAIQFAVKGVSTPRPMTHDLLRDVVAALGEAREVRITELKDRTFFAELLVLDRSGAEQVVPCRPSDGIAVALRAGIPILVAEALLDEAARKPA